MKINLGSRLIPPKIIEQKKVKRAYKDLSEFLDGNKPYEKKKEHELKPFLYTPEQIKEYR